MSLNTLYVGWNPQLHLEKHAFGADNYHPLSQSGSNFTSSTGIGYTLIDSISTHILISFSAESTSLGPSYRKLRKYLKEQHTFDVDASYSTFELTIRLLGGLLSAHWAEWELGITPGLHPVLKTQGGGEDEKLVGSGDGDDYDPQDLLYLHKAVDLADRLSAAFETRSGLPLSNVNLMWRKGETSDQENGLVSTAEVGTLQLEFRYAEFNHFYIPSPTDP
jgi:hypothetical protein